MLAERMVGQVHRVRLVAQVQHVASRLQAHQEVAVAVEYRQAMHCGAAATVAR